ncbi:hypothetical protein PG985_009801 [Apiospora marii]|uniref:uncharacterized protein n=1 Tax=Apiospora marii TaxID=335849 RepID=UPI00312DF74C
MFVLVQKGAQQGVSHLASDPGHVDILPSPPKPGMRRPTPDKTYLRLPGARAALTHSLCVTISDLNVLRRYEGYFRCGRGTLRGTRLAITYLAVYRLPSPAANVVQIPEAGSGNVPHTIQFAATAACPSVSLAAPF